MPEVYRLSFEKGIYMDLPSIKKNYIYRLSYELLVLMIPFITTPYISRVLGADGIGIYSYTTSVMTYFTLFAALGTGSYGAREIAQHRDDSKQASKLFWEIELMTVVTSGICLLAWVILILFSKEYRYYYLALMPLLLAAMADISWFFTGYEQVKYIVIRNTICKILGIILLFAFVRDKSDLIIYVLINTVVQLMGNLSMWTYVPRMLVKVDFKSLTLKKHFHETLVYFIPTIATSIYTVLDKTLIGIITGNAYQNGYYEQAAKVINIINTFVFTSVNSVMVSRISYLFAVEKYDEIHRRIEKSMSFIFLTGFGCGFGMIGIAKRFVPVFFGKGYEPVVGLLYLMSPLVLIIGVSNCLGSHYYTPSGRKKQSAKYIIVGSCVNLCLNLILISLFGASGATVASIAAESIITVLYVRSCNGYITWKFIWKIAWKRGVAGILMLAALIMVGYVLDISAVAVMAVQICTGVCVYSAVLLILHDDLLLELIGTGAAMVRSIVRRKTDD